MEKITKEALKKKELNKLNRIFKNLPDDKKNLQKVLSDKRLSCLQLWPSCRNR